MRTISLFNNVKCGQTVNHSVRKDYDYSESGYYSVTLCTQNRLCLFGNIDCGVMLVNVAGRMITDTWHAIPEHYPRIELDEMTIMPNHLHGIIVINDRRNPYVCPRHLPDEGRAQGPAPTVVFQ